MTLYQDTVTKRICDLINAKNHNGGIFHNFEQVNSYNQNLLLFYLAYIDKGTGWKNIINSKDLDFIISYSNLNHVANHGHTALSYVLMTNHHELNNIISSEIISKLMTPHNMAAITDANHTVFELACINYYNLALPLSKNQFAMLYEAHKIVKPEIDEQYSNAFINILKDIEQKELRLDENTNYIDNYLFNKSENENIDLKQKIKILEDRNTELSLYIKKLDNKINSIEQQLSANSILLSLPDKPTLDTQHKLGNAISKLAQQKAKETQAKKTNVSIKIKDDGKQDWESESDTEWEDDRGAGYHKLIFTS